MLRADIVGIMLLETGRGLAVQVPAGVDHMVNSLVDFVGMHRRDAVQG